MLHVIGDQGRIDGLRMRGDHRVHASNWRPASLQIRADIRKMIGRDLIPRQRMNTAEEMLHCC